jgi:hypothetical protein
LADLAGLKLGSEPVPAPSASAAQYTFVMEGAALKEAGVVSAPVTTPSKPSTPSWTPPAAATPGPRRFGLAAVLTPWVLVVVLAALHLVRS